MSFDVIFTQSAQSVASGQGELYDLEERTRDEIAELPGDGLTELEARLFHSFALDERTEVICTLTADGAVRVDACPLEES